MDLPLWRGPVTATTGNHDAIFWVMGEMIRGIMIRLSGLVACVYKALGCLTRVVATARWWCVGIDGYANPVVILMLMWQSIVCKSGSGVYANLVVRVMLIR